MKKIISLITIIALLAAFAAITGCSQGAMDSLTLAPAGAESSAALGAPAPKETTIILDDYEPVKVGQIGFSFIGKWSPSTGGMDYEGESHWAPSSADNANIAYFRPSIAVNGPPNYEVFIIYPDDPNDDHATDMPVTIHYGKNAKLSVTKIINLKENTGEWISLGIYELRKGKKSYLEFGSAANGNVMADAAKFGLVQ